MTFSAVALNIEQNGKAVLIFIEKNKNSHVYLSFIVYN
jgi:hypothetical protein